MLLQNRALSRDTIRALRNSKYEQVDGGTIFVPSQKLMIAGLFRHNVNGLDHREDPNLIVDEGLNLLLDTNYNGTTAITSWYLMLYTQNASPLNTWNASNFNSNATEFTNYTQSTRVLWVSNGAASLGPDSVSNSSSVAVFTMNTGGGNIWGAAMVSVATKSSGSGKLNSASKFAALRALNATDNLNIDYSVTLTST